MALAEGALGFASVIAAALAYGSSYVPARSFEVHDGVIFNWYQMQGVLAAGMAASMFLNNWNAPAGSSFAFYVHPEGLLAGVIYQVASLFAVQAVKRVGLGVYYTVHEFTNVGAMLFLGFVGPSLGFPAKVPSNVPLALLGAFTIGLGMIPTVFIEPAADESAAKSNGKKHLLTSKLSPIPSPRVSSPNPNQMTSMADVYFPIDDPTSEEVDTVKELNARSFNAYSWSRLLETNAHTWDGGRLPQQMKETIESFHHTTSGLPSMPWGLVSDDEDDDDDEDMPFPGKSFDTQKSERRRQAHSKYQNFLGLVYSLVAGGLFGIMFAPMPIWKARMKKAGIDAPSADFVFAVCVGASLFSSCYLLLWSTVKKVQKQKLVKSVLRPALSAGIIYYFAMLFQFYAISQLPYAVASTSVTGLALAASMIWGIAAFGEMKGPHNRRMAALSFAGVIIGAFLMAIAA